MSKLLLLACAATALAVASARGSAVPGLDIRIVGTGAPHREPTRSVWDSVFTDSQAVRGDSVYKETCVKCHGATLAGGDDGTPPPAQTSLATGTASPSASSMRKFARRCRRTSQSRFRPEQLADVVAYMLAKNLFPAGATTTTRMR